MAAAHQAVAGSAVAAKDAALDAKNTELLAAKEAACDKPATNNHVSLGAVALDVDGNNKVDTSDAIELFVATTMQGFGARDLLLEYRSKYVTGATTPVTTVLATVSKAIDQYPM